MPKIVEPTSEKQSPAIDQQPAHRKAGLRRRSMILPEAYDERAMPSLQLARSSRYARHLGNVLAISMLVGFFFIALAPWQQSVRGTGSVIAYDPNDRVQPVEAPTKGRIVRMGPGIYENAHVKKGQLIAEIEDLDPDYFNQLKRQYESAADSVRNLQSLIVSSETALGNAESTVTSMISLVNSYENLLVQAVAAAEANIAAAQSKVAAEQEKLVEVEAGLRQATQDYERQKLLYEKDIVPQKSYQIAEQKYLEAKAKVAQSNANIAAAKADLANKRAERESKAADGQSKVDYAMAQLEKSRGDVAKIQGDVAKYTSDLNKAEQDLSKAQVAVSRQRNQSVTAPFDGFLMQIMSNNGSKIVKEGDPIAIVVPDSSDRAVQVWLDGNDAPLVTKGRHVRLQFEGWPAIQFAGWPSVAVGTFGGKVVSVDPTDDGKGKFRILVLPDPDRNQLWPDERFLRQGVRANGWVLLEQVPLWYEIWRNMNGFPPVVEMEPKEFGTTSKPKIPK